MSPQSLRRVRAIAATVALGACTVFGGSTAYASHAGDGDGTLTALRFGAVQFPDHTHTFYGNPSTGAWAPDGSRVAVAGGAVFTLSIDGQDDYAGNPDPRTLVAYDSGLDREDASWRGANAYGVVWSERVAGVGQWHLMTVSSTPSCCIYIPGSHAVPPRTPRVLVEESGYNLTKPDGAEDDRVVYQRQAAAGGTSEIWIYDPSAVPTTRLVVSDGMNPAISPDGNRVTFVRSTATGSDIWTSDLNGANLVQIATGGTYDEPNWSPDGSTIAFSSGNSVLTAPADGSAAASPANTGMTGTPAFRPETTDHVLRLAGASRFKTAIAASQAFWATAGSVSDGRDRAHSVVLSRSDNFADALGGSALAANKQGPLLLTTSATLDPLTGGEIDRILDPGDTVYLLGGTDGISTGIQNALTAKGYTVTRLAGSNRFETSIKIANTIDPTPDIVLTAPGTDFPDALAAGAAAGSFDLPGSTQTAVVVLTQGTTLPAATKDYITKYMARTGDAPWAIGGSAASALAAYDHYEVVGRNRYETSQLVAYYFFGGMQLAGVTIGTNWPDALAGGALMATLNGPLVLTPGNNNTLDPYAAYLLGSNSASLYGGLIFGNGVSKSIDNQIGFQISGPGGFLAQVGDENGPSSMTAMAGHPGIDLTPAPRSPFDSGAPLVRATN